MLSSKYQGRIDPLELLKGAVAGGKKAKLKDKHLIFDKDIKMSLNTPTAWVSQHTKKQYSLGALWLLLECHNAPAGEYMKKVSEYEVETVNVADRNEIIKYFEGKISDSDCINQELKLQLASKNHKR